MCLSTSQTNVSNDCKRQMPRCEMTSINLAFILTALPDVWWDWPQGQSLGVIFKADPFKTYEFSYLKQRSRACRQCAASAVTSDYDSEAKTPRKVFIWSLHLILNFALKLRDTEIKYLMHIFFPAEFPAFIIIEIQKDLWPVSVLLPLEGSNSVEDDKDGHIKVLIERKLLKQLQWKMTNFIGTHTDLSQVFILLNQFGNDVKLAITQHCFRFSHLNFNII